MAMVLHLVVVGWWDGGWWTVLEGILTPIYNLPKKIALHEIISA